VADPTSSEAQRVGSDGDGNEQSFSRRGLRNVGYFKAALGLGVFHKYLSALGVNTQFNYDYDSVEYIEDQKQGDARKQWAWQLGGGFDALAYRVPVQLDLSYDMPISGSNVGIATENILVTLKGYYKF
jgi:hypothetical protein